MKSGKKKLLFVNESLSLAGGEKSLIALLSNLDPEKYEIDLQLFRYGGELEEFIPSYVNVLRPIAYTEFTKIPLKKVLFHLLKKKYLKYLIARLKYSFAIRQGKYNHPEKAQFFWENIGPVIEKVEKHYDAAIAYAQGVPTFYVSDKITARKKIAWVNAILLITSENRNFQAKYYNAYNKIVAVTPKVGNHLSDIFPQSKNKIEIINDILDYQFIHTKSKSKTILFDKSKKSILTVSRLNKNMKGIDIALETCLILKKMGIDFHWYFLGEGDYKDEFLDFIKKNRLKEFISLLGVDINPYPYYKAADLYVQTSRYEGYGLSIAEARLLNVPIVTTRFDTVYEQMVHEENGLVVDIDAHSVAEGIQRLITDKNLYERIKSNLINEPKENLESVKRFDLMISQTNFDSTQPQ